VVRYQVIRGRRQRVSVLAEAATIAGAKPRPAALVPGSPIAAVSSLESCFAADLGAQNRMSPLVAQQLRFQKLQHAKPPISMAATDVATLPLAPLVVVPRLQPSAPLPRDSSLPATTIPTATALGPDRNCDEAALPSFVRRALACASTAAAVPVIPDHEALVAQQSLHHSASSLDTHLAASNAKKSNVAYTPASPPSALLDASLQRMARASAAVSAAGSKARAQSMHTRAQLVQRLTRVDQALVAPRSPLPRIHAPISSLPAPSAVAIEAAEALAASNNGKRSQTETPTSLLSVRHAASTTYAIRTSPTAVYDIAASSLRTLNANVAAAAAAASPISPQTFAESEQQSSIDESTSLILQQLQFVDDAPHSSHASAAVVSAASFGFAPSDAANAVHARAIAAQILGHDEDGLGGHNGHVAEDGLSSPFSRPVFAASTKALALPPLPINFGSAVRPPSPSPPTKLAVVLPAITTYNM
jgi:hypothetical protein